jgi:uncharacterized protein (UPF0147 family)
VPVLIMQNIKPVMDLLDQIINDRTVPKNIRAAAEESKNILSDEQNRTFCPYCKKMIEVNFNNKENAD